MGYWMTMDQWDTSGERLNNNELERSTIFNGETQYFDWATFNNHIKLPESKSILLQ